MEFALFKDLVETLGKILKGLTELPQVEREKYRQTMDETYRLIDTTLNMVIIRLGDILLKDNQGDFLKEIENLDNYSDWMQAEREFRLCQSLRAALRETENLRQQLTGPISTKDWDTLLGQMGEILQTEGEVALFISEKFRELADAARSSESDPASLQQKARSFRDHLIQERKKLIQQEIELFTIV